MQLRALARPRDADLSLLGDARARLDLAPHDRLTRLGGGGAAQDALQRVAGAGLRCVVVGEVAGALQRWPLRLPSRVLELACDHRDQERLANLLN